MGLQKVGHNLSTQQQQQHGDGGPNRKRNTSTQQSHLLLKHGLATRPA